MILRAILMPMVSPRSAYSRSPSPRPARSRSRSPLRRSSRSRSASPEHLHSILVTNLTRNVKEDHIREIFGEFGKISYLEFPINKLLKTNKGKAYIDFETQDDADKAISYMDNAQLDGKRIACVVAPKHRERSPSPRRARYSPPPFRKINSRGPPPPPLNRRGDRFGGGRDRRRRYSRSPSRSPIRRGRRYSYSRSRSPSRSYSRGRKRSYSRGRRSYSPLAAALADHLSDVAELPSEEEADLLDVVDRLLDVADHLSDAAELPSDAADHLSDVVDRLLDVVNLSGVVGLLLEEEVDLSDVADQDHTAARFPDVEAQVSDVRKLLNKN
ncbi:hypothetical protein [Parasitella parasitica]|uniref:RRM domain-containing protein n=1 Tax=Parasitella parasitica TaxID=35722 RepID=A0A0B7N658_9FUNG|nr:hypothetical protein [Parasitella parasitica]